MEIGDQYVKSYLYEKGITSLIAADEARPWGAWWLFENGKYPVTLEDYDRKILKVNPADGARMLSLQFHGSVDTPGHREEWRAITDILLLIGQRSVVGLSGAVLEEAIDEMKLIQLKANESIEIPAGYLHALINPWSDRAIYVEETRISPGHVEQDYQQREENIVRIYDQTGRGGLPDFPDFWKERIKLYT